MFDFRTNITKSVLFLYLKSLIPSVFKLGHWHLSYHGFNLLVLEQCMCHEYLEGLGEVPRDAMYLFILSFIHLFIFWSQPGIGFASCWMAYIVAFYYNMVIAWAFYYLFSSFTWTVPWSKCDHDFNTPDCWQTDWDVNQTHLNRTYNSSSAMSSSFEYFEYVSSYQ